MKINKIFYKRTEKETENYILVTYTRRMGFIVGEKLIKFPWRVISHTFSYSKKYLGNLTDYLDMEPHVVRRLIPKK